MKLLLPVSLALAACGTNASLRSDSRRLSYEKIGEYEPMSKVTDHVSSSALFTSCRDVRRSIVPPNGKGSVTGIGDCRD